MTKEDVEIAEEYKTLLSLPKKELIKIIQYKNDLLVEYVNQVEDLKGRA